MTLTAPPIDHLTTESFAMPALPPTPDALQELFAKCEEEIRKLRAGAKCIAALGDECLIDVWPVPEADWDDESDDGRRFWYYRRQIESLRTAIHMVRYVMRGEVDDPADHDDASRPYGRAPIPERFVIQ